MVLAWKTNFFLGKRWFWEGKPTFPRETQKNQQNNFLGDYAAKVQNDGFLVFPRKKMVLDRKTN